MKRWAMLGLMLLLLCGCGKLASCFFIAYAQNKK